MTVTVYIDGTAGGISTDGDGSIGNPYRSLYWASTQRIAAFNSATEDYEFRCKSGVDLNGNGDNGASFSVNTTSATARTLLITVDTAGDRHTGVRGTGYRFPTRINVNNANTAVTVRLVGLSSRSFAIDGAATALVNLDDCVSFDAVADHGFANGGGTSTQKNCAAISGGARGFSQFNNTSAPTVSRYNCVALANGTYGFHQAAGTATIVNCYSGGNTTEAYNGTITKTNCAHDTATTFTGSTASTAYSTANLTNVTADSEDFHLPSGSALIAAGVGPSSNANVPSTDFEGTARGGATTDIGPDQRTAFAGGSTGRGRLVGGKLVGGNLLVRAA
jgi:hypothetical protein